MIISCCHLLHTSLGSYLHYCLERSQHNVIYCHTFWISLSTIYLSSCFRVSNYLMCQYFFSNVPFDIKSICVLAVGTLCYIWFVLCQLVPNTVVICKKAVVDVYLQVSWLTYVQCHESYTPAYKPLPRQIPQQ